MLSILIMAGLSLLMLGTGIIGTTIVSKVSERRKS